MNVIIDYGIGNFRSVKSKIEKLGHPISISSDPNEIMRADKIILPGVGHFAEGMKNIKENKFDSLLSEKIIQQGTPILGICMGMQLFLSHSEEGNCDGLNWVSGQVRKFNFTNDNSSQFRVPHVGWNLTELKLTNSILFKNIPADTRFYFTHSYFVEMGPDGACASTNYGINFTSAIEKPPFYGVQFHPEKSHKQGLQIIDNFLRYAK